MSKALVTMCVASRFFFAAELSSFVSPAVFSLLQEMQQKSKPTAKSEMICFMFVVFWLSNDSNRAELSLYKIDFKRQEFFGRQI